MTPDQYLASLQQEFAAQRLCLMIADCIFSTNRRVNIFDTPEFRELFGRYNLNVNSPREVLIDTIAREDRLIDERRHALIISFLTDAQAELLSSKGPLAVGSLEFAQFNASAIPAPGGEGAILAFRRGLDRIIYRTAKLLLSMVESNKLGLSPTLDLKSGGAIFLEILRYYHSLGLEYNLPQVKTSESVIPIARLITEGATIFLHCHELAHVMLGHLESGDAHALPTTDGAVIERAASQQAEFDADQVGLELVLAVTHDRPEPHYSIAFTWAGIWLFLQLGAIFESFEPDARGSHPSALERLNKLEALAKKACRSQGLDERRIYMFGGPMSRVLISAIGGTGWQYIPSLPSPLEKLLEATLREKDGLLAFQGQLFMWLATTALPRRFCEEVGRIRAEAIQKATTSSLDLRQANILEVARVVDTIKQPEVRMAVAKWLALTLHTPFSSSEFMDPLLGDYLSRIDNSTERHFQRLCEA